MTPVLAINIVVGMTSLLYFIAAYIAGHYVNPWWYGFWSSYGAANICWLKATGVL